MTYADDAQRLAVVLRSHGVTVSVELEKDVQGNWSGVGKRGVISHHTASHDYQGLTPCLAIVKRGRAGLLGPLANGYGGRDLVYRIICMGKANHAGTGGPLTLGGLIPKDYGNSYLWGTEYEGGYEEWTDAMREFMGRSNAGLMEYFGWGTAGHAEHKTWTSRKIDRLNYSTQSGRDEIVKFIQATGAVTPVNNTPVPVTPHTGPWANADANAVFANGSRTVLLYSAGSDVKFIQSKIGAAQDGYFGNESVTKTKAYQRAHNLVPDAIVGSNTWASLLATAPVNTDNGSRPAPGFPLPDGSYFGPKSGPKYSVSGYFSHREDLRAWQQRMKDRGWKINPDGLYGNETDNIATLFQREKGLGVDGKIGPVTWAAAWTEPVT